MLNARLSKNGNELWLSKMDQRKMFHIDVGITKVEYHVDGIITNTWRTDKDIRQYELHRFRKIVSLI